MGGAPKVEAPKATAEEKALQGEQTALLRQQREILMAQQRQNTAMMPIFAKQLGLELDFDPKTGEIRGAKELPGAAKQRAMQEKIMEQTLQELLQAPEDRRDEKAIRDQQRKLFTLQLQQQEEEMTGPAAMRRKEIEGLLDERTLKALRGELEVDPALERDLRDQGETLKERLQSQLGPGYETSSAGIEALQKFEESSEVLRSQARKGELSLSEQLSMARQGADNATGGFNAGLGSAKLPGIDPLASGGFAFGLGQGGQQSQASMRSVLASPLGVAGGLGQVAAGYQMPIGSMQQDRSMQLQANMTNANNEMSFMGGMGSLFGSIFGALPFSSDEYNKTVLARVAQTEDGMGIYIYEREGEETKLGVIAQDVAVHRPWAVVEGSDGVYRVHREAL